jgi:hypothetical protein
VREVGREPVDGRLVELDVAGVDDRAVRRDEREGAAVGDRVRDLDDLDGERLVLDGRARDDLAQVAAARSGHSRRIDATNASVSRVPYTGSDRPRSRSR